MDPFIAFINTIAQSAEWVCLSAESIQVTFCHPAVCAVKGIGILDILLGFIQLIKLKICVTQVPVCFFKYKLLFGTEAIIRGFFLSDYLLKVIRRLTIVTFIVVERTKIQIQLGNPLGIISLLQLSAKQSCCLIKLTGICQGYGIPDNVIIGPVSYRPFTGT